MATCQRPLDARKLCHGCLKLYEEKILRQNKLHPSELPAYSIPLLKNCMKWLTSLSTRIWLIMTNMPTALAIMLLTRQTS